MYVCMYVCVCVCVRVRVCARVCACVCVLAYVCIDGTCFNCFTIHRWIFTCVYKGRGGEEKGEDDVEGKRKREERSLVCGVNNWCWGLSDGMAHEGCRGGQGFGLRRVGGRAASGKCRWGGK